MKGIKIPIKKKKNRGQIQAEYGYGSEILSTGSQNCPDLGIQDHGYLIGLYLDVAT